MTAFYIVWLILYMYFAFSSAVKDIKAIRKFSERSSFRYKLNLLVNVWKAPLLFVIWLGGVWLSHSMTHVIPASYIVIMAFCCACSCFVTLLLVAVVYEIREMWTELRGPKKHKTDKLEIS